MATSTNNIIVLDDDDDEDEAAAQPGPSHPPPSPASFRAEAPGSSQPPGGAGGSTSSGSKKCFKLENKKLFDEFLELCKSQTSDHPEVVPFLSNRHQRTHPLFLASAEFCNVLTRALSRAQSRPAKLYVYINDLCTILKANSIKKKMNPAPASTAASEPSGSSQPPADPPLDPAPSAENSAPEVPRPRGSRRQIQRLEQLLALYVAEIRRLQEKELDLSELDNPDSTYMQEDRLKRKLIRLFGRLCELKQCSLLTGRVIEQRIPYRGTRYPEVNRCIERLINKPGLDAFPDYGDVLQAVQKAATRHSLGLPRQQLQLLAQDAFRDVGVRLQERRHLDLIYNFGCHLTDDYRPGVDPALSDPGLARRLRENRSLAMSRLDEVISKYARMQDQSEEGERQRRARLPQAASSHAEDPPSASLESGEGPSGMAAQECLTKTETDDEDDDESEEEEEEEEVTDSEEDLEQIPEGPGDIEVDEEEEEEGETGQDGDKNSSSPLQVFIEEKLEPSKGVGKSSEVQQDKEIRMSPSLLSGKPPGLSGPDAENNGGHPGELCPTEESPMSQVFELEIEAVPLDATPSPEEKDISSSKKQSEEPLNTVLENGAALVTYSPFNGGVSQTWRDSSPPCKKSRREKQTEARPLGNSYLERQRPVHENGKKICVLPSSPPGASLASIADSSTRVDSPSHGLVTSSVCNPAPAQFPHTPQSQASQSCIYKTSVATQCDPEEIIVLSDSD